MRIPLALGKKSAKAVAPMESVERLLNGYLEIVPDGKEPTPIYGTGGLTLWCTGLSGAARGGMEMGGVAYWVMGTRLYSFTSAGVATDLGAVPNADMVQMAGDGTNIAMVSEGEIYIWNGTTLGPVTDPDAPAASSVAWSDGYFIFGERGTQRFFISALADPTNYDALDFASAEYFPDLLLTPFVHHRILYLAGVKTFEAQQNTGAAAFPFARYDGVNIDVGLAGRDAIVSTNDAVFWLAPDDTVRRLDGITATKISTTRIGKIIKGWTDKTATVASAYVFADHLFVKFRNPDGCVVWDQNTETWHEEASYQSDTWRGRHVFDCYGLTLVGDASEGKIYVLDPEAYDENGAVLPFQITTPFAYAANKRLTVSDFEVVTQRGVGSLTLNPQITLERTKDGETWSDQKTRRLGKQGERGGRALFGPQGQGRAMAFRIGITDPVQRAVLGCYAEVDVEA